MSDKRVNMHNMIQNEETPLTHKRFNLYLPLRLWRRLEKHVSKRSKDIDSEITPTMEIRRAIEKHLDAEGSK
jgi:hypothetical protein